jgi:hypothetical protein
MKGMGKAIATLVATSSVLFAGVSLDLKYPNGKVSDAKAVMEQVYFVNHFYAFKNYSIEKVKRNITVIVKRSQGKAPLTLTVERFLNNEYRDDNVVKAKDLAVFRSGKLRGMGMLITDYEDDAKSQEYLAWLPALRKIRRFAQPAHDDAWGGTDFTFGDVTLRKPMHETHELLGTQTFGVALDTLVLKEGEKNKYMKNLPTATDEFKGAEVYKVKSTTKFKDWWYDHRITYVDTKTFADYRTEYFKNGKQVKVLDKNWQPIAGQSDPRALRWYAWYGKNLETGHESLAYIPEVVTKYNQTEFKMGKKTYDPKALWTKRTLTKIKR